jgi:hypothetical protein
MKHVGRLIACMIVLAGSGSFGYTTKTCEPGEYIDGYCIISGTSPHQSCAAHDDEPLNARCVDCPGSDCHCYIQYVGIEIQTHKCLPIVRGTVIDYACVNGTAVRTVLYCAAAA